jgi:hypothetical protein
MLENVLMLFEDIEVDKSNGDKSVAFKYAESVVEINET